MDTYQSLNAARLAFLRAPSSIAHGDDWELVPPDEVPESIRDPDVIGRLLEVRDGPALTAQAPEDGMFYRPVRVD